MKQLKLLKQYLTRCYNGRTGPFIITRIETCYCKEHLLRFRNFRCLCKRRLIVPIAYVRHIRCILYSSPVARTDDFLNGTRVQVSRLSRKRKRRPSRYYFNGNLFITRLFKTQNDNRLYSYVATFDVYQSEKDDFLKVILEISRANFEAYR